jgi:arylsulfatase A-like enzyme
LSPRKKKTAFKGKIGTTIKESRPWWPDSVKPPSGAPNILIVLFDDVGFSDFGCYGSPIRTPAIDRLAVQGLRYSGFHTTAMCSTTRSALLTGRNHHSVGVGCLANFDSGYPGYRGKIAREAGTIAEMLRPHGYRNYIVGKWHVTPLTESGPTGPFDGWPLGRGFDHFYGFLDAETDQYSPELVVDNTHIEPPGSFESGYHLTADLVDQSIRYIADHTANLADFPWLVWLAFGACHAPHQAPFDLIAHYDSVFKAGWDIERDRRIARQKEIGLIPKNTRLPARNDGVFSWDEHSPDEQRLFARLQAAYAAMLDHADQHIGRLVDFLERAKLRDNTIVIVMSDNGASQEGGPLGQVNAMGPYNFRPETLQEKIRRIDDIGGPDTHSNFPFGWAMAANTPLRRYKQNTHGGGIRDPFVISWPKGISARGEIRHQFAHACDLVPTLLDVIGVKAPPAIERVSQQPIEGVSFAASLKDSNAPTKATPQYFEMFGHRGLWEDGWKAVAYHPPGTPFETDKWELFHLDADFSETNDLASAQPEKLKQMIGRWWEEADKHKVLPLDDRFGYRFVENAARFHGPRRNFVFHYGMGHVPTDVAPDVRSRGYLITADVEILDRKNEGVLIAHGDATSGYSLYVRNGRLFHDLNIGGNHQVIESNKPVPVGSCRLGVRVRRGRHKSPPLGRGIGLSGYGKDIPKSVLDNIGMSSYELMINDEPVGKLETRLGFITLISWSGLDIGRDRGSPVSHYKAPFEFTGNLLKVTVDMDDDQVLDGDGVGRSEMARQ